MPRLKLEEAARHLEVQARRRRTGDRGKRSSFLWSDLDAEAISVVLDSLHRRSAVFELEMTPEALARQFHETYERLATNYGYTTRRTSAVPWEEVPEPNKSLMIAVATEILK